MSYYLASAPELPPLPRLRGHARCRVAVVGGGYAGLATALGLAERGLDAVHLLEAARIGHGASGRNGGFVFAGFSRDEARLLAELGPDAARAAWKATQAAIALIRQRIERYAIDCEAVYGDVIWANVFANPAPLRKRRALLAHDFDTHWPELDRDQLQHWVRSPRYTGALREPGAFHMHPLKLARGLASAALGLGVELHEHSPVRKLERDGRGWCLELDGASLRAEQVVLACGGYRSRLYPAVHRSILPIATYMVASEPLGERLRALIPGDAAVYDTRFAFDYYRRSLDGRLLWGGRISVRDRRPQDVARLLRRDIARVFPELAELRIEHAWSGLMGYARHQMPQMLEVEPGLWCLQAFGGHGVATTTLGGELIAAAIAEGDRGWQRYRRYGLERCYGPLGLAAAQLKYWWLQGLDVMRERLARR